MVNALNTTQNRSGDLDESQNKALSSNCGHYLLRFCASKYLRNDLVDDPITQTISIQINKGKFAMLETHINKTDLQNDQCQSNRLYPHVANATLHIDHREHDKAKSRKSSNDRTDLAATISHAKFWELLSQIKTGWLAQTQAGQQLFRRLQLVRASSKL